MIKRTFLALAFLAGLLSPVFAAGTISLSLMQQFGTDNKPLNGGLLYFYQAGTTTPQNAFQDSGLTIPWPNPLTLGSTGRVPQLFFADGQIKVRLTNAAGVVQLAADNLLVVGPSSGGGGGGSVDPTTVIATGDLKVKYGTGILTGFVRANGRTIGSATSGATERANADAQPLFEYLWNADPNLAVSTGRGASSNADWTANKTITLPDWRGRGLFAMDDMGNTSAARLSPAMSTQSTTLGGAGGSPNATLSTGNLPPYTPGGIVPISDPGHAHSLTLFSKPFNTGSGGLVSGIDNGLASGTQSTSTAAATTGITANFFGTPQGGTSAPFNTLSPVMVTTFYLKL